VPGIGEVEFHVDLAERRTRHREAVKKRAVELSRFYDQFLPGRSIHNRDLDTASSDPVAEFARKVGLNLLARHESHAGKQRMDLHRGARPVKEFARLPYGERRTVLHEPESSYHTVRGH